MKVKSQTVRKYYKYIDIPWTQPIVTTSSSTSTSITTPEHTIYSCWGVRSAGYALSNCFDGSTTGTAGCPIEYSSAEYDWIQIYNPEPIKASEINIYWHSPGSNLTQTSTVIIEASNDGENWTTLSSGTTSTSTTMTDIVLHTVDLSNNTNFYNYYKVANTTAFITNYRYYWYVDELQITATQKTIVESTSSDYDFYEDVDVYKVLQKTVRKYYKYSISSWTQPIVTASSGTSTSVTTPEGTIYSCNWIRDTSYAMSYAFDGIIPTTYSPQCACFVRFTGQSNWVEVYNPNPIKVSQIIIYWSSGSGNTYTETINIEASNDGANYVTLVNGATHSTNATVNPHTIPVNNNDFYNYYKITNTTDVGGYWCVGEIEITATQKTIVESTSSDYDFYEDINAYMAVV